MVGIIGSWISGFAFKIALFFIDKALVGVINGTMTPELEEKIGEYTDSVVDKFQAVQGDAGKLARVKVVELCDKIKENLQESD